MATPPFSWAFDETQQKRLTKGQVGHLRRGMPHVAACVREIPHQERRRLRRGPEAAGRHLCADERVDVIGISKGRGFQGGVKRHGFHGGPRTHGQSDRLRAPGASSSGTTPGRIYKGKRMAGHMGNVPVTVANLRVVLVDAERNLLGRARCSAGRKRWRSCSSPKRGSRGVDDASLTDEHGRREGR